MSRMETIEVPAKAAPGTPRGDARLALAGLAVIALLQVFFALDRSINWDEFYFYGQVVDYTQGTAMKPLQTLHVQLFQWIPGAVATGVDGIVIGRIFMLACAFATAASVALIAGKFARTEYALTAALIWLAAGFTMQHGWSFRTDPLATAGVTGALVVLARTKLSPGWVALAGALVGFAGMVSVKAILFAPAFAGLAWLRWSQAGHTGRFAARVAAIPMVAILTFGALYVLHGSLLGNAEAATGVGYAKGTSQAMLFAGWPIYLPYAVKAAALSIPAFAAIILTLAVLGSRPRDEIVAIIGLLSPLAALIIYRNTLPYFYPMMLAPVVAASVVGIAALAERYGLRIVILFTTISGSVVWMVDGPSQLDKQRDIQLAADAIFEEPVGYFDFPDMLPSHVKSNTFLTRWGIESVQNSGEGYFRSQLEAKAVPLLVTAEPEWNPTLLAIMEDLPHQERFRKADRDVLRATYRHFWGPLWLAGSKIEAGASAEYEVLVPGPYTVTGGPIAIDGKVFVEGDTVELERGFVTLNNTGAETAGIIWGERLEAPAIPAPERPYWQDF